MITNYRPVIRRRQMGVIKDEHRFIILVTGRRWAKTTTAAIKLFKKACQKPGFYGYLAPTYNQAKLIAWEIFKSIIPPHYRLGSTNESELYIRLRNGSVIRLFGLDKAERILGIGFDGVIMDEYDQTKKDVYEKVIRPALSDKNGFCWFIGNPDATKKKLKDLYDDVRINQKPDFALFHYKTIEGGYVPDEEIESAKKDLDPRTFRENYEASFEDLSGQVYYGFHPDSICERDTLGTEVQYRNTLPLRLHWDFNVNPFCVGASHFIERKDEFGKPYKDIHVVDEFVIRNSNTPEMCKHIIKKYENHKAGLIIYGDATGKSRDTSSALSDYQIITDAFKNFPGFQLRIKEGNPAVKDRINSVNSKLCAYDGKRHVFIKPGLKALAKDFMNVVYKEGTTDLDKTDLDLTHTSDGFGYMCEYEFPVTRGYLK